MRSHEIQKTHARPQRRRLGRGNATGRGTTAGRGTKGQKARSGFNLPRSFTGGSTPNIQRIPKLKGFKSAQVKPVTVSMRRIAATHKKTEKVSLVSLMEKGLITAKEALQGVKVVGSKGVIASQYKFEEGNEKLRYSKKLLA